MNFATHQTKVCNLIAVCVSLVVAQYGYATEIINEAQIKHATTTNPSLSTNPSLTTTANSKNVSPTSNSNHRLPLSLTDLYALNTDQLQAHQALPQNVPTSYNWEKYPRMGAGNTVPANFSAITAWGQIFWVNGVTSSADYVAMRNEYTLLCTINNAAHTWFLLQQGNIVGAEFSADYSGNINKPAPFFSESTNNVETVGFDVGTAFQFWPQQGRATLPSNNICGVVVVMQARTVLSSSTTTPGTSGAYLIGFGGDYWLTTTAPWNNYTTNSDIDIGQLRFVGPNWQWYGFSTATDTDLLNLYQYGYSVN